MSSVKSKKEQEEISRLIKLKHRYNHRITVARFAKESLDQGDYGGALKKFAEYMGIIAEVKEMPDIYSIRTSHFDPKTELTEMLMISHIFFEMARLYDAVPKFHPDSIKCLEQFVHFSANQPYQVVNSELIRKYLKKSSFKNPTEFRKAHDQIHVQSKKCYVVTHCFGNDHQVTQDYRALKDWLLTHSWGLGMVQRYYSFSSVAVPKWEKSPGLRIITKVLIKPTLLLFSKTILPVIIK